MELFIFDMSGEEMYADLQQYCVRMDPLVHSPPNSYPIAVEDCQYGLSGIRSDQREIVSKCETVDWRPTTADTESQPERYDQSIATGAS